MRIKCHSKRLVSSGAAVNDESVQKESSWDSFRMRLIVGDFALKPGVRGVAGVRGESGSGSMLMTVTRRQSKQG